jgi:hypothetical protein
MPRPTTEYETIEEWRAEAVRRFGADEMGWRFRCPVCGHEAAVSDWKNAGTPQDAVAFSCVGRWLAAARTIFADGPGPCNYAGGGLLRLNPVLIAGEYHRFDFGKLEGIGDERA